MKQVHGLIKATADSYGNAVHVTVLHIYIILFTYTAKNNDTQTIKAALINEGMMFYV